MTADQRTYSTNTPRALFGLFSVFAMVALFSALIYAPENARYWAREGSNSYQYELAAGIAQSVLFAAAVAAVYIVPIGYLFNRLSGRKLITAIATGGFATLVPVNGALIYAEATGPADLYMGWETITVLSGVASLAGCLASLIGWLIAYRRVEDNSQ